MTSSRSAATKARHGLKPRRADRIVAPPRSRRACKRGEAPKYAAVISITAPANSGVARSQICATTPRSWVTKMTAVRCASCMARRSARSVCTVTSSAVVGSSATMILSSGEGRCDQDALAHAAGQLMRIRAARSGLGCALRRAVLARVCAPQARSCHGRPGRRSVAPRCAGRG